MEFENHSISPQSTRGPLKQHSICKIALLPRCNCPQVSFILVLTVGSHIQMMLESSLHRAGLATYPCKSTYMDIKMPISLTGMRGQATAWYKVHYQSKHCLMTNNACNSSTGLHLRLVQLASCTNKSRDLLDHCCVTYEKSSGVLPVVSCQPNVPLWTC